MDEHLITVRDGSTVAIRRLAPDAWEVRHDGEAPLVVERATRWGWTVRSNSDYSRPWMSVREAFVSTHAEWAASPWGEAVAVYFEHPTRGGGL